MPQRAHLFSLRIAHALRAAFTDDPYTARRFLQDLFAGITVGIIAIPLSMALAVASGVAPQYGLYTAIVGGFVIAVTGGSRYSVSGPTAAFVVILYPIAQRYGLGGLMVATMGAGLLLVAMALLRLGRLIEYIPTSVTLGFTSGIAVVIAMSQLKDTLGLTGPALPEHFHEKLIVLAEALPTADLASLLVAAITLGILILWPRFKTPLPPHLPAVLLSGIAAYMLNKHGADVATIGSQFIYTAPDGTIGHGIPGVLPDFEWPWLQPGPDGQPVQWSWGLIRELVPSAFAIAMLGAIESLLCAVVLDGMTGTRHSANSELLGQGLGNIVAPMFGGISATAAIARSTANHRAGAESPLAAAVHSLVVLLAVLFFARLLSYLPMPAMGAMLIMVAWSMSEAPKAVRLIRTSPASDIWVFACCFSLTILFDMVMAITAGIILAAVLFMKEIAAMTKVIDITGSSRVSSAALPEGWSVFKISGPLFFAAADKVFGELAQMCRDRRGIVLYMDGVTILDAGGLAALTKLISNCEKSGTEIKFADLQFQPLKTLARANIQPVPGVTAYYPSLQSCLESFRQ